MSDDFDGLPSAEEMLSWIETIVAQGIRRPGYPADAAVRDWAARRLREWGLEVRTEPVEVPAWYPGEASLLARLDRDPSRQVALRGFPLPFTAPTSGTTGPLARLTDDIDAAPGFLAVDEIGLVELPQAALRDTALGAYDPDREFDTLTQTLPFTPRMQQVAEPAMAAGAGGYLGATTGFPWDTRDYYVPYDTVRRPIPGLWLSRSDSLRLLGLMAEGPCTGLLTARSEVRAATSANVVATLPGNSDHWVVVGSHHDAPWASAVEDASGIALVLAAAAHWARVPRSRRPHNLLFLLTAGHMTHHAGTRAFVERHRADLLPEVVLELHLEHAALHCRPENGELVPTPDPEVRWWFTSPEFAGVVLDAITAERLRRSLVFAPDAFFPEPPTDGALFHRAGVPLVQFLSAPMYLFDSRDTMDKIDADGLVPLSRAAVRIVASTAGRTPPRTTA
ncbi:M28 family peptidase [Nocardia sp. CDC159]|uniref:M28 family peptidase n=1 Tax=Nocardia pulmonis TaxID=2951408 RepID=A0A9X2E752_9NOCA|nr:MULTISPECIES: M28 family peptidase [Nocardia]MCM6774075.1 M28 family peptidase [Nocardia pulmonis]MCM6786962.1 M28 family peptidase [Nocardia sp. CDC159]